MSAVAQLPIYKDFIAAGYIEGSDLSRIPNPHEYATLCKSFKHEVDGESLKAYLLKIRVYDMHRLKNYPRVDTKLPRWNFEANVQFHGSVCEGLEPIPTTTVSFVVESVEQAENHARRLWLAMGQTTE